MVKSKVSICPRCDKVYTDWPATSRRDDKTCICPECGQDEAHFDLKFASGTASMFEWEQEKEWMNRIGTVTILPEGDFKNKYE